MAFTGGRTGSQSLQNGCLNVCGPILLHRLEKDSGLLPHEQSRPLSVRPN